MVCLFPVQINDSSLSRRPIRISLCGLLLQVSCSLLQAEVALLVGTAGTETNANKGGPCSSLEQEDRENDTETETESRLDEEVG